MIAGGLALGCSRSNGSSQTGETPNAGSQPDTPDGRDLGSPAASEDARPDDAAQPSPAGQPGPAAVEPEPLRVEPGAEVRFAAADGAEVFGRYHAASGGPHADAEGRPPIVVMFHQAGANAAEYQPIVGRVTALGYAALAIDQRSGGRRFGQPNQTVEARGDSTGFSAAFPDLVAAVDFARGEGYGRVAVWGSSYSAALVFRLCAERGDELAAVLAFSPGEYLGKKGKVAKWAVQCSRPVFVTAAPNEWEDAGAIAQAVVGGATTLRPKRSVHGSSALRPDRNPKGLEEIWAAVEPFLAESLAAPPP